MLFLQFVAKMVGALPHLIISSYNKSLTRCRHSDATRAESSTVSEDCDHESPKQRIEPARSPMRVGKVGHFSSLNILSITLPVV
jgi:hypothetical protein